MTNKTLPIWLGAGVYLWLSMHAVTKTSLIDPPYGKSQDISYSDSINPFYSFHIK